MLESAPMPDNATTVTSWLKARKGDSLWINCVMTGTGVTPFQEVNQIVHPLEDAKDFRYMKTTCSECSRDLKCVGFFG